MESFYNLWCNRLFCDVYLEGEAPSPAAVVMRAVSDTPSPSTSRESAASSSPMPWSTPSSLATSSLAASSSSFVGSDAPPAHGAANERGVWAHKLVLAAASVFFLDLFRQSNDTAYSIPGVATSTLRTLVGWIYSPASINLDWTNVEEMMGAASRLQLERVRAAAHEFLSRHLCTANALQIATFAERHGCTALAVEASTYADVHGEMLLAGDELLALSPPALARLLGSDRLAAPESLVFDAVLRWTQHRPQERQRYLSAILSLVRLPLVPREMLLERATAEPLVDADRAARLLVLQACRSAPPPCRRRRPRGTLLVVGGHSDGQDRPAVLACSLPSAAAAAAAVWRPVAELPAPLRSTGVASIEGSVYAFGGKIGSLAVNAAYVYSAGADSWSEMAAPATNHAAVCALGGRVYAVGGVGAPGDGVEAYDPREGAWRRLAALPTPRHQLGAAAVHGSIYAVGGNAVGGGRQALTTVERYDPAADRWEAAPAMGEGRRFVGVAAVDGSLYAVGGVDVYTVRQSVEYYRAAEGPAGRWRPAPRMPASLAGAAVAAHGGQLVVAGGADGQMTETAAVLVFTPADGLWREATPLPTPLTLACATVVEWPPPDDEQDDESSPDENIDDNDN